MSKFFSVGFAKSGGDFRFSFIFWTVITILGAPLLYMVQKDSGNDTGVGFLFLAPFFLAAIPGLPLAIIFGILHTVRAKQTIWKWISGVTTLVLVAFGIYLLI